MKYSAEYYDKKEKEALEKGEYKEAKAMSIMATFNRRSRDSLYV